jgi:hypothetical protein
MSSQKHARILWFLHIPNRLNFNRAHPTSHHFARRGPSLFAKRSHERLLLTIGLIQRTPPLLRQKPIHFIRTGKAIFPIDPTLSQILPEPQKRGRATSHTWWRLSSSL